MRNNHVTTYRFAILLIAFAIGIATGAYLQRGATLMFSRSSPDGTERIDFYYPTRWQALFHTGDDMPASVILMQSAQERTLGASRVFDLSGGSEVFWDKANVQVGSSAIFDRATGKWTIVK